MPDYQQRVLDEWTELHNRLIKLHEFIQHSTIFAQLSIEEQSLLAEQANAMSLYEDILQDRINLFNA